MLTPKNSQDIKMSTEIESVNNKKLFFISKFPYNLKSDNIHNKLKNNNKIIAHNLWIKFFYR